MIRKNIKNQSGFTILELLIAMSVFTLVLLIATTSIVELGKLYYKTLTAARNQEVARTIMEEISRTAQFDKEGIKTGHNFGGNVHQFCIGDRRYTYEIDSKVINASSVGLRSEEFSSDSTCARPGADSSGTQLLAQGMRLISLDVNNASARDSYRITVKVAYADNDLLSHYPNNANDSTPPSAGWVPSDVQCRPGIPGSSFCAVNQLDTTVKKRLR